MERLNTELQEAHEMYKGLIDQERETSVDMQKQVCVSDLCTVHAVVYGRLDVIVTIIYCECLVIYACLVFLWRISVRTTT